MVATTYDAAMIRVFADEGGFTNDPQDPGGATNWGITLTDARKYWKADASPADVRAMPKNVAADIYRKHYATPIKYNELPAGFDYSVLDASINSGQGRAIPWAAKVLKSNIPTVDSVVTLSNAFADKVALIQSYWALRLSFLHGLRTWSHFGTGWSRRCANGEAAAVRMFLAVGTVLTSAQARARLDQESAKAKKASKNSVAVGTGTAAGGAGSQTIPASHIDASHPGGKIALAVFMVVVIAIVIMVLRNALIHQQRATAYATT